MRRGSPSRTDCLELPSPNLSNILYLFCSSMKSRKLVLLFSISFSWLFASLLVTEIEGLLIACVVERPFSCLEDVL